MLKNLHQCLINAANAEGLSTEIKKTLSPLSSLLDLDALTKECLKLPVHVKIYNKEGSVYSYRGLYILYTDTAVS